MIGSLVRWFGGGAGRGGSGRGAGSTRRFTPRLEALEDRAVPGGAPGGVLGDIVSLAPPLGAKVSGPSHVSHSHVISLGHQPAGVGHGIPSGFEIQISRSSGEEIPQTL
jgi:hypothetical protein